MTQEDTCWAAAKEYTKILGPFLPVLSSCIRLLRNPATSSDSAKEQLSREITLKLLECPGLRIPFYFAAQAFGRKFPTSSHFITEKNLFNSFRTDEFVSILTVLYLYRRATQLASPQARVSFARTLQKSVDLGKCLSEGLSEISSGTGLLVGGMREIGYSVFLALDDKGYGFYRLRLKNEGLLSDLPYERKRWGCTYAHIVASMLLELGYGTEAAFAFYQGMTAGAHENVLDLDAIPIKVMNLWIASLIETGEPPETNLGDEYQITEEKYAALEEAIPKILTDQTRPAWLTKSSKDLTADLQVKLFGYPEESTADYANLSPKIRETFSLEEWSALKKTIQGDL